MNFTVYIGILHGHKHALLSTVLLKWKRVLSEIEKKNDRSSNDIIIYYFANYLIGHRKYLNLFYIT